MFLFFAIKIYTAYFTYRTLDCVIQWRIKTWEGRDWGRSLKNFLRPFGLKISGGPGPPGPSPGTATVIMYTTKGETL